MATAKKATSSKALAAWTELNDRQQGTLAVIYDLDQEAERAHRMDAARGDYDRRPASEWRAIDFAHDPSDRRLFGTTEMQMCLAGRGWDNQGNGATLAALASRGLITQNARPTTFGRMLTVALTRQGRAAARAGLSLQPGGASKAALGRRAWEVLALLWEADTEDRILTWRNSTTIERVLIGKHVPPLAERITGGYQITERGRTFYRQHHAAHAAAHPDVHAPHPDGEDAEPWPGWVDEALAGHQQFYLALCKAWGQARTAQQQAQAEADAEAPQIPDTLPAAVAEQITARHALWTDTARQRADLAAAHTTDLRRRAELAARAYAAAALTAFTAAVNGTHPPELPGPRHDDDGWDEPRLAPPPETGIHAIDAEATKLHAAAVGTPLKRRGPAPTRRRTSRRFAQPAPQVPDPGTDLAALARHLHRHTEGGTLLRRLHPLENPS